MTQISQEDKQSKPENKLKYKFRLSKINKSNKSETSLNQKKIDFKQIYLVNNIN